jgi:beta-glucanase (GH16 family)
MKSLIVIVLICLVQSSFAQVETLVWSDEFNGTGVPDPANWGYDLGSGGWGNNEVQTYTNSSQNARQENGFLIIEALKQGYTWTSARILTNNKHEFKYGRIVFRAKMPVGSGTWPALWLLGENFASKGWPGCGEIDVLEHVGKDPGWVQCATHTPSSYGGGSINFKKKFISTANSEFHTYQLNWTYEKLEFSIDSVLIYTYRPATRNTATWPFDKPFFLIMNLAMGGNMGSDPQYETGGQKNGIDPALNSARLEVDYVKVYQYPAAIDDPSGGKNNLSSQQPFLYPNPSEGVVRVTVPEGTSGTGIVYNLYGKKVFDFFINGSTAEINLTTLPGGLYFISLQAEGKTYNNKLIIK